MTACASVTRARSRHCGAPAGVWPAGWIDRCYLPLRVGEVLAVGASRDTGGGAILLDTDEILLVADDLQKAVDRAVRPGDLVCLRADANVVVSVDFLDARPSLVSARLRSAAALARDLRRLPRRSPKP